MEQTIKCLLNLSHCENSFFVEVSFPDIHDDTHAISLCSSLQSQCEAHGSLRTVAEQFSINAKDVCDISFVSLKWSHLTSLPGFLPVHCSITELEPFDIASRSLAM